MSETLLATFGVASGIINLLASIPYFIDIFRGNTKPERATWWMWFALGAVGLAGQIAGGAHWSLVLSLSSVLVAGTTALLSVRYGYGRFHTRDMLALIITAAGIALSLIYQSPLIVVATVVTIDTIAGGLTLYKTWHAPLTENLTAWSVSTFGITCGLLAVGDIRPVIFLSPLFNFLMNGAMVVTIFYRRSRVSKQSVET